MRTGLLRMLVVGLIGCDTERDSELAQLVLADRLSAEAVEVRDNRVERTAEQATIRAELARFDAFPPLMRFERAP